MEFILRRSSMRSASMLRKAFRWFRIRFSKTESRMCRCGCNWWRDETISKTGQNDENYIEKTGQNTIKYIEKTGQKIYCY